MKPIFAAVIAAASGLAAPAVAQDAAAGESVFNRCKACHMITAPDGEVIVRGGQVGPNLYGIAGRQAGTVEDFRYSDLIVAAGEAGLVWDEEAFDQYVVAPTEYLQEVSGDSGRGKMQAQRLNDQQLDDVWAYLSQFGAEDGES